MVKNIIKHTTWILLIIMVFPLTSIAQVYSDAIGVTASLPQSNGSKTVLTEATGSTFFIPNGFFSSMNGNKLSPPGFEFNSDALNWGVIDRDDLFVDGNYAYIETPYALVRRSTKLINNDIFDIYNLGIREGSYIIKRDASTGENIWEYHSGLDNNDKYELDLSIQDRQDGNIETYGFRLFSTGFPNPVPAGLVNRKVFNSQTGDLISQKYSEFEDNGSFCINPNGQLGRTFPITEDELYLSICAYVTTDGQYVGISKTGDGEGILLDTVDYVENKLEGFEPFFRYFDAKQLPNGNIAVAVSSFVNPTVASTVEAEVLIFNPTGELIDRISVNELLNYPVSGMTINVIEDKMLLTSRSLVNNNTESRTNLAVIDEAGNVYHQYNELEELNSGAITLLEDGRLLVAGNSFEDNCLNIFIGSDGDLDLIHSLCHEDEQWSVVPRQLLRYGDDVILKGQFYYDTTYMDMGQVIQEKVSTFETTLSLSLSQIGITVSTNDIPSQKGSFTLFPNPSSDKITISGDEVIAKVEIYDLTGQKLLSRKTTNNEDINIQHLVPGSYFVKIYSDKGVETHKLLKVN